jgi:hypothetical protein
MNFKKSFKFCCAVLTCIVVDVICQGILSAGVDPCPNYVAVATTPCPFSTGDTLYDECPSSCDGYISYSAESKNTQSEKNENSETYTTSVEYVAPQGYVCANYVYCIEDIETGECGKYNVEKKNPGKLYTQHGCND